MVADLQGEFSYFEAWGAKDEYFFVWVVCDLYFGGWTVYRWGRWEGHRAVWRLVAWVGLQRGHRHVLCWGSFRRWIGTLISVAYPFKLYIIQGQREGLGRLLIDEQVVFFKLDGENDVRMSNHHLAYSLVTSLALFSAAFLLVFHSAAASLFRGSSGLGSANKLWIESKTDFICRAGDQFFFKISRQILPKLSTLEKGYRCWDGRSWYRRQL